MTKDTAKESKLTEPELFADEYKALCEKYGLQIIVNPAFKARDDGTWSVVLQPSIGSLPARD